MTTDHQFDTLGFMSYLWFTLAAVIVSAAVTRKSLTCCWRFAMSKWAKVMLAEAAKRQVLQAQVDGLTQQNAGLVTQNTALTDQVTQLQVQVDALTANAPDADDTAELASEEAALNLDADGNPIPATPPVDTLPAT